MDTPMSSTNIASRRKATTIGATLVLAAAATAPAYAQSPSDGLQGDPARGGTVADVIAYLAQQR